MVIFIIGEPGVGYESVIESIRTRELEDVSAFRGDVFGYRTHPSYHKQWLYDPTAVDQSIAAYQITSRAKIQFFSFGGSGWEALLKCKSYDALVFLIAQDKELIRRANDWRAANGMRNLSESEVEEKIESQERIRKRSVQLPDSTLVDGTSADPDQIANMLIKKFYKP